MIRAPLATFVSTMLPALADDTVVIVFRDQTAHSHLGIYVLAIDDGEEEAYLDLLKTVGFFHIGFQGTLKDCKDWLSIKPDQPGTPDVL